MIHSIERDGEEIEVEVDAAITPGRPARLYGPPELCHPEEPAECEILSAVRLDTGDSIDLTDEERQAIEEEFFDVEGDEESDREAYLEDSRYDAWVERSMGYDD